MIGLINAIGAEDASRQLTARRSTSTTTPDPTGPQRAPVLSAEQAANRVLRSAVEAIEFQQSAQERAVQSRETATAQAREEPAVDQRAGPPAEGATATNAPGQRLDVTA